MSFKNRRKPSRIVQAIIFLALLALFPLALEYLRQSEVKQQWLWAEATVQIEAATEAALQAALETRKAYVQTDAYVEEAARAQLKMARPGDVVIVVVTPRAPNVVAPTPAPSAAEAP